MKCINKARYLVVALVSLGWLILPPQVQPVSATGPWFVSTNGNDGNDCATPATPCASINAALNKPGFTVGDTVNVAVGVYIGSGTYIISVNKDASLSGGWDLTFTTQSGMSTIDGQGTRQGVGVDIASVTMERFIVQNATDTLNRGAVVNFGTLTLRNVIIESSQGGGVYNGLGTLTLDNVTVRNISGRGLFVGGVVNIIHSTITGNAAGIYSNATLTITDSTISNNTSRGIEIIWGTATVNTSTISGNGHSGLDLSGSVVLNNSTISGNQYGGIANHGTLTVNSSTIVNNTGDPSQERDGIINWGTVSVQNTIITGNTPSDCEGPITSSGYNIVTKTQGCTFNSAQGDQIGVDPRLHPLRDNGGPTFTHALSLGSPGVDAGNPAGCTGSTGLLTTDQRGKPRLGRCDVGAFEGQANELIPILNLYLPMLLKKYAPPTCFRDICGHVTMNGNSLAGVNLELRFYNGSTWSTSASASTDSYGLYTLAPGIGLLPGQAFYVRYQNSSVNSRLSLWATREIRAYTPGDIVSIGDFDLANIPLISPPPGASVTLPSGFQWGARPATLSDSYEFNLFDPNNPGLAAWTPPLGYINSFTLNGLPGGFVPGDPYGWYVGVYSPDGGYGTSYYYRRITFLNTGVAPLLQVPSNAQQLRDDRRGNPPVQPQAK